MKQLRAFKKRLSFSSTNVPVFFSFFTQPLRVLTAVFLLTVFTIPVFFASGETVEELRQKITNWNSEIASLEADIAKFEEELAKIGSDRKTLEAEIARLDLSRQKIATDIAVTQNRIAATGLQIDEIEVEIDDKVRRIDGGKVAVRQSLQRISKIDNITLLEHFLGGTNFSDAWEEADRLRRVQVVLNAEVASLEIIQQGLEESYQDLVGKQNELVSFTRQLSGQRSVLDQTRQAQSTILTRTRSEEAEYQKLLQEKRTAREQLEADLRVFEAELQYTLDPSSIPAVGSGVLKFPLDASFMGRCRDRERTFGNVYCITQYFGNTPFARSGAYSGQGHNGIDFGSPEGTRVVSSLSGIVQATGDTDVARGCFSYGKWVLVRHANGISTLYAHLSHISVSEGDAVPTGGLLGLSGNTGYSTGPHLHFSVFASNGVQVRNLRDWYTENGRAPTTACARGGVRIPVAPTQAYLNPLNYL